MTSPSVVIYAGYYFFGLGNFEAPRYEHSFVLHMSFNRPITKTNPLGEILFGRSKKSWHRQDLNGFVLSVKK